MPRLARLLRRALLGALWTTALVALALGIASRTGVVQELVRRRVTAFLQHHLTGTVSIGGIGGTLGRSLVLRDFRIALAGRTVVAVPRAVLVYTLPALVRGRVHLRRLTIDAPRVRAVRTAAGWEVPAWVPDPESRPPPVRIDRLEIRDGRAAVALADASPPRRLAATGVALVAAASVDDERQSIRLDRLELFPRGVAVGRVHASADLAHLVDTFAVRDLDVTTGRSRVLAAGRVERGRVLDAHVLLAPLDRRDVVAVAPALPLRTSLRAVLEAHGAWDDVVVGLHANFGTGGRARAGGRLDLAADPVAWRATLATVGLDPAAIVDGGPSAAVDGHARARGAGVGPAAPLEYTVALGPSRIAGHELVGLDVRGTARTGVHRAALSLATAAGRAHARVGVTAGPTPRYRVTGDVAVTRLEELLPSVPGSVHARFTAAGVGIAPGDRRAALRVALTTAALRGVALNAGGGHARLDGERLRVTAARADGLALHASGAGTLRLDSGAVETTGALEAQLAALGLARAGTGTVEVTARGALARLDVAARVGLRGVEAGPAAVERLDAAVDASDLGAVPASARIHADATGVRVAGDEPRDATADLDWRRGEGGDGAELRVGARRGADVTDRLVLALARTPAATTAELRELQITPGDHAPWRLVRPATFVVGDGDVTTTGLVLAAGEQRLVLAGRAGVRGPLDASLEATAVPVGLLCALGTGPTCEGRLGGRVALTGTAADPRLAGTATAADVRVDGVAYGDVRADVQYADRRLALDAALRHPAAGELHLDGSVPVDLSWGGPRSDLGAASVDLRLHAARLDLTFLRALAPYELRQSAGRLAVDVRITGPRAAPRGDGRATLADGRFELASTGLPWEDATAELVLAGEFLELRALHAHAGDGTLDGHGTIRLGGDRALDLTVRLEDFLAVRREAVEAEGSGEVAIRGTLAAPDVRGALDVTRGVVRPAALPVSGPSLDRDATIAIVGRPEPPPPPPPTPASRLAAATRLAVDLRLARNVWIRRTDANIELGGAVRFERTPPEPVRVGGTIRLLRGWYAFQGRRFEIEEGAIRFTGASPPQPVFDITAVYQGIEYRIVVRVSGSSTKPTLKLSSDPPLEEADILSVLLFGKPASQLGRGESVGLQRQALQLASGYVAPELRTSVMNSLGLDILDVELQQGTENPGRVTVGRYVSSDVLVSLGQEFGSRAGEVLGVEYGLTPRVSVKGSTSTRGDSAIDLFWHRRY